MNAHIPPPPAWPSDAMVEAVRNALYETDLLNWFQTEPIARAALEAMRPMIAPVQVPGQPYAWSMQAHHDLRNAQHKSGYSSNPQVVFDASFAAIEPHILARIAAAETAALERAAEKAESAFSDMRENSELFNASVMIAAAIRALKPTTGRVG